MAPTAAQVRLYRLSNQVAPGGCSVNETSEDGSDECGLCIQPTKATERPAPGGGPGRLIVTDERTGKKYTLEVSEGGNIKGNDLAQIKAGGDGNPLRLYDPGYMNTVPCISRICYIDGGNGILRYRGIPIQEVAERSSFVETAFLLLYGRLPVASELREFNEGIMRNSHVPQGVIDAIAALPHDTHPMTVLMTGMATLGAYHPDANPALAGGGVYDDPSVRSEMVLRVLGAAPTLAAIAYHKRNGSMATPPNETLGYAENFLYMLDAQGNTQYRPNTQLARAIDIMFILHAEHELNCSTSAMRHLTSSGVDVFSSVAGALGALYGPLHGGANEAVLKMLHRIGSLDNIPAFIERVKAREEIMFGFGHRVYKNYDPRAKIIRTVADQVFAIAGHDPLIQVAERLEQIARSDSFFVERKLYPNVDFYSGLVYRAMGFPPEFFTVLFAVPRCSGWMSHWIEALDDKDAKIMRPQQDYRGPWLESYVPMEQRPAPAAKVAFGTPPSKEHLRKAAGLNWI